MVGRSTSAITIIITVAIFWLLDIQISTVVAAADAAQVTTQAPHNVSQNPNLKRRIRQVPHITQVPQITEVPEIELCCPTGYIQAGNSCYLFIPGSVTYTQAYETCKALGVRVVWFDTFDELMVVNSLALSRGITTYWIGLQLYQGRWIWSNGVPATFTNWRPTQPDGCCGAFVWCVMANYMGTSGQWDDAGCNTAWPELKGYICKTTAE